MNRVAGAVLAAVVAVGATGCSAERPTKEEYLDAMLREGEKGAEAEEVEDLLACVVDESYDKLSTETLRAIVDGDERRDAQAGEMDVLNAANLECVGDPLADLREEQQEDRDVPGGE